MSLYHNRNNEFESHLMIVTHPPLIFLKKNNFLQKKSVGVSRYIFKYKNPLKS